MTSEVYQKVQVWVFSSGFEQVLLLKRLANLGSYWQPVTGKVEEGETLEVAALRELAEETGIRADRVISAAFHFSFVGRWGPAKEHVFFAEIEGAQESKILLDPTEHVEYQWYDSNEALGMMYYESNVLALAEILNKRNYRETAKKL